MKTLLHLQDLQKSFGQQLVLNHVGFELQSGEIIGLIGPSGAGKTSALNILGGMDTATSGKVVVDGKDIKNVDLESLRSQMGIMLQDTFL